MEEQKTQFDSKLYIDVFRKDYVPIILEKVQAGLIGELEKYLAESDSPVDALNRLRSTLDVTNKLGDFGIKEYLRLGVYEGGNKDIAMLDVDGKYGLYYHGPYLDFGL
jgi:hypothetical protein